MNAYTEDNLVQKTTAEYLVNSLDWNESVYAMQEVFGAAGTLGRTDEGEVLLVRYLRPALERLNPGLPAGVYGDAIRILSDTSVSESLDAINREKYKLLLDGIPVRYTAADGTKKKVFLRVFDFANPTDNHFLCAPEVADRHSGYHVVGTSPFGTKKRMKVYIESTIFDLPRIYINAGHRGICAAMAPTALEAALPETERVSVAI